MRFLSAARRPLACLASGLLALAATAPAVADATGQYRITTTPVIVIDKQGSRTDFSAAVRLNRSAPASKQGGLQLAVAPLHRKNAYGSDSKAHRIGRLSSLCYYSSAIGSGTEGLPASLRHAKAGQMINVVAFYGQNGRVSRRTRLQAGSASNENGANEAWFSRQMGCGHR